MKVFRWILIIVLLAGATVLCFFRWQAWFGMPVEPEYNGDTLVYHFSCFGEDSVPGFVKDSLGWQDSNEPQVLRLAVLGDVHNQMDSADYAAILARHDTIDAVAQVGDWVERCYFYYLQQLYHQLDNTGMENLPVIACPGNHEYFKGLNKQLPDSWYQVFHNPKNGPQRFEGSAYYVDFPRLRCIVLDTPGQQRLSDYTITFTWLKNVMQTAGDRFVIVMMHYPVYSPKKGRLNAATWLTFHRILRKADVVFAGHDHSYSMMHRHFYTTNSSRKVYHTKKGVTADAATNSRLYEIVEIKADTLRVSTYSLDSLNYVQTFQFAPLVQDSAAVAE